MVAHDERAAVARQLVAGTVGGALSWTLGYLLTYLWRAPGIEADLAGDVGLLFDGDRVVWKIVGWLFFNAHSVSTKLTVPVGTTELNFVSTADDPRLAALYLVPPILLGLAGLAVARWTEPSNDPRDGGRAGATIVLGYALLSTVGVVAFTASTNVGQLGPDPVRGILLAGVLYPLCFGALGGVVATTID